MPARGVTYDYFFKEHPRNFFAWMEVGAEGAQYFGRLSGKALVVAKNIYKTAVLFQIGCDIPFAFQSFQTLYHKIRPVKTPLPEKGEPSPKTAPSKPVKIVPVWIDICYAVSNVAFLTDFGREHILEQPSSPLIKLVRAVADLIKGSYDLYTFVSEWKNMPIALGKEEIVPLPDAKGKPAELPVEARGFSWDIKSIGELTYRISFLALTALSLAPLFKGIDTVSPLFSIVLSTIYLGSHFAFYEDKKTSLLVFAEYQTSKAPTPRSVLEGKPASS